MASFWFSVSAGLFTFSALAQFYIYVKTAKTFELFLGFLYTFAALLMAACSLPDVFR